MQKETNFKMHLWRDIT